MHVFSDLRLKVSSHDIVGDIILKAHPFFMCNFKMTFPLKKVSQEKKVSLLSALPAAQSSVQRIYIVGFALHHHDSLTLFRKKEVCTHLFALEKCFKIFYVNILKKEKLRSYFPFSFRATLSFTL